MNQLFRVEFRGNINLMKRLLEAAAVDDGTVIITSDERIEFSVAQKRVSLFIDPNHFSNKLRESFARFTQREVDVTRAAAYSAYTVEAAVIQGFFGLAQASGLLPRYSELMPDTFKKVGQNYLTTVEKCGVHGPCRGIKPVHTQYEPITYSWSEGLEVSVPIATQSYAALGAVSNSSKFTGTPAREMLLLSNRPAWLRGKAVDVLMQDCGNWLNDIATPNINGTGLPAWTNADDPTKALIEAQLTISYLNYTQPQHEMTEGFCKTVGFVMRARDLHEMESYYQLGTNLVVYPGAWLKFDIDDIAEFTTARSHKKRYRNERGVQVREIDEDGPELLDMLALNNVNKTVCVNGGRTACLRYATREPVQVLNSKGEPVFDNAGLPVMHTALDYECDPADMKTYCPYSKEVDHLVRYDIRQECHEESSSFLIVFGGKRTVCQESGRTPITVKKHVALCRGFRPVEDAVPQITLNLIGRSISIPDPNYVRFDYSSLPDLPPVTVCSKPRYKCAEWNLNCNQYRVNENFILSHETPAPRWRSFDIQQGEYPPGEITDNLFLKLVWPGGSVKNCQLSQFPRRFRGNTWLIRMPTREEEDRILNPLRLCQDDLGAPAPIWNDHNVRHENLPKVFMKNTFTYIKTSPCGKTEFVYDNHEVTNGSMGPTVIPPAFVNVLNILMGPVPGSCRADPLNFQQIGNNFEFTERPLVKLTGRISVLGRMLENILHGGGP